MTTYARCSDCNEQIPASAPNCPVCLRERSRKEIFDALSGTDPVKAAGRKSAFSAFGWLLMAVAVVYGGMQYQKHSVAKEAARVALEKEAREAEKKQWESDPGIVEERSNLPPASSRVSVMSVSDTPAAAPQSNRRPLERVTSQREEVRIQEVDTHWTVSGDIYDLVSLKPVRGLYLYFQGKSGGKPVKVITDQRGHYSVRLPKEGKVYSLKLKHRKYDGTYVEESSFPFRQQTKSRRIDHYRTFRQAPILHVPLTPLHSEDAIEHSFVMLPD